jgi:hypothetical protein
LPITLIVVLVDETGLQRFEGADVDCAELDDE